MTFEGERGELAGVFTLVVWVGCAVVGVVGLEVPYGRPGAVVAEASATRVEVVKVEVAPARVAVEERVPERVRPLAEVAMPAAPQAVVAPSAQAEMAVAAPVAAMAFAVPVEGMTRMVAVDEAAHGGPVEGGGSGGGNGAARGSAGGSGVAASGPVVMKLTLGVGEGRQPLPAYPREAVEEREEGVVVLRFGVEEDGRVTGVEVVRGSRWPLLNQAAVRAVRETWRFGSGEKRIFEVPIEFELGK